MDVLDNIKDKVKQIFNFNKLNADFLQYIHIGSCKNPCVDYESGKRNGLRLFYSNDGLMFYSINHGESEFVYIK